MNKMGRKLAEEVTSAAVRVDDALRLVIELDNALDAMTVERDAALAMLTEERLGEAIHRVYCHDNRPMHSAPDHSAAAILAALREQRGLHDADAGSPNFVVSTEPGND